MTKDIRSPGDDPEILDAFLTQVDEFVRLAQGCSSESPQGFLDETARVAHRCWGDAEFLELPEFSALARALEKACVQKGHRADLQTCLSEGAALLESRSEKPHRQLSTQERAFLARWSSQT